MAQLILFVTLLVIAFLDFSLAFGRKLTGFRRSKITEDFLYRVILILLAGGIISMWLKL